MEYKAPKLRLKKRKSPRAEMMKADVSMTKIEDGKKKKKKPQGKIIRIKSGKVSEPSAKQLKLMRKDYERESNREGKYQLEKKRLKKERDLYDRILRMK